MASDGKISTERSTSPDTSRKPCSSRDGISSSTIGCRRAGDSQSATSGRASGGTASSGSSCSVFATFLMRTMRRSCSATGGR